MPRFRIVATITCPRHLARLIPLKLRKEARKLRDRGVALETLGMEEID